MSGRQYLQLGGMESLTTSCVCDGSSTVIGEIALAMRDLSRGRSMEKEFALTPMGFLKVLMYLSLGHGTFEVHLVGVRN